MIMTFNACLALVVALLIIGTLNHMQAGKTPMAVMFSMVLIFAGMVGQGAGVLIGQLAALLNVRVHGWDHFVDTLLYGGLLAFVLACRRFPLGRKSRHAVLIDRLAIAVCAATLLTSLALIP